MSLPEVQAMRGRHRRVWTRGLVLIAAMLALGVTAAAAQTTKSTATTTTTTTTVNVYWFGGQKAAWDIIVPNFERVYPDIKINVQYAGTVGQLLTVLPTQLASGSAADIIAVLAGDGSTVASDPLARNGLISPITGPWNNVRRSVPFVTALNTRQKKVYAFTPGIGAFVFAYNKGLFRQLGLSVPTTFSQLLGLCARAKAAGTTAIAVGGGDGTSLYNVMMGFAGNTVFSKDPTWMAKRRAGTVSFAGTPGWRTALQQIVALNTAGCFQTGAAGAQTPAAIGLFAGGRALTLPLMSAATGGVNVLNPNLDMGFFTAPAVRAADRRVLVNPTFSLAINSKSGVKAAAATFINFLARPKQNALYARLINTVSQYDYVKNQLGAQYALLAPLVKEKKSFINPNNYMPNGLVLGSAGPGLAGLLTGQRTIDEILKGMDDNFNKGSNP